MSAEPDRFVTEPLSPKTPTSPRMKQTATSTQRSVDYNELKEKALKLEKIPRLNEDEFTTLRDMLINERNEAAAANKFRISIRYEEAIQKLNKDNTKYQKIEAYNEAEAAFQKQIDAVQEEIKNFDSETTEILNNFKRTKSEQRDHLLDQHEAENNEHTAKWSSEAMVRMFNRASHQLVQLRKQFKLLVNQCRFQEADDVKKIIDNLERNEKIQAHRAMQEAYDISAKKLDEKQELEINNFDSSSSLQYKQLVMQRSRARLGLINRLEKIQHIKEQSCDIDKVWNSMQMKRKAEAAAKAQLTARSTKIDIISSTEQEDAVISLPPLTVRRPSTRASVRSRRTEPLSE